MSKSLLVTRPNHDETTNYLYYWSTLVIKEARKRNFSVYNLAGNKANKKSAVAETIIYARSCDAGITLGKRLIKDRAKAFIGYNRKFILGYTPQKLTRPLSDSLAKLFLEPSNLVVTTLIKSKTAQAAQDRSKQAMWKNFRRMTANRASSQMRYTARWLWSNYKSQVLYGDAKAAV